MITVTAGGAIAATDVASVTDNDANDISLSGVGIAATLINAGSTGDVTLNAGTGAITQDGTDDKDDVTADQLDITASSGNVDIDTSVTSVNITALATKIDEANNIDLGLVSVTTLDLVAGTEVTDDAQTATVAGATKVEAGTDIVLDTASNTFGELTLKACLLYTSPSPRD